MANNRLVMNGEKFTPSKLYRNYVLALLLAAYILSFVDRLVLSMLVGPIRQEFDITDFQFSLLHGFAFAILYSFMGIPLGRIVDSHSRRLVVSIGVFSWSVMTCLCGLVQNIQQLFIARVGVGVGEASLSPGAYSLLGDYFKAEKLPKALSIFAMGVTLGGGLAYIIGGAVYQFFASGNGSSVFMLGSLKPWQSTFIVVGLPGFIIGLLLLFIKEPARQNMMKRSDSSTTKSLSFSEISSFLLQRKRAYLGLMLGASAISIVGYGILSWYPEFLQRTYDMPKEEAGKKFGLIFLIAGASGTYAGTFFSDFLRKIGYVDANMRVTMLVSIAAFIPAVLGPLSANPNIALICVSIAIFFHYAYLGPALAALQIITPNQMRGQVGALLVFMTNIMGLAFGGSLVAFFTDYVFGSDQSLNKSIAIICGVFYPLAAVIIYSGLKAYRESLKEVGHWNITSTNNNLKCSENSA
ncbi:MFS transporter [Aestuariicella hydrocarbonica]|uniref:MFS transporter n=1 Tax=Pseudomaricurvus hydrocarbonicus TaxID=1470433 RepID=A0A9E5JSQ2_9GAMM|nr:MFS transporter [Aestuariicella hydrocarbonica]NHO66132.1 MFS transporter [Aestuariicella hydrocarbonica]